MIQRSLTICMVTNNYVPYSGGVVSSIQALAHELRQRNHRVIISTLDFDGQSYLETDVERMRCIGHCRYKGNPISLPLRPKAQFIELIKRSRPDIIHIHHPFLLGSAAVRVARRMGIPTVFTHHSFYEQYSHYIPLPEGITRFLVRTRIRRFCAMIDQVIVPSTSVGEYLYRLGVKKSTWTISSGILPLFMASECKLKKPLSERIVRLLTVSRFVPEKNIEWLLDMFALLSTKYPGRFSLTLIGYGAWLNHLERYAYGVLKLAPSEVLFREKPSKSELVTAYQESDLFVFASQSETQGLVLAEAFSQGTPVIALKGPGIVDSIQEGINGFVALDMNHMIAHIEHIVQYPALFSSLQQGAFETSHAFYPAVTTQRVLGLYEMLLDKR